MAPKVIDWDGVNVPPEFRELPPGRYTIEPIDPPPLSAVEEAGLIIALDELEAGQGIPLAEVMREILGRSPRR